jgi:hypothetical protein
VLENKSEETQNKILKEKGQQRLQHEVRGTGQERQTIRNMDHIAEAV